MTCARHPVFHGYCRIMCSNSAGNHPPVQQFSLRKENDMHNIIYLVGLVVVVGVILSFLGLA